MVANLGQFGGQVAGRGRTKVGGIRNFSTTDQVKDLRESKQLEYRRDGGSGPSLR